VPVLRQHANPMKTPASLHHFSYRSAWYFAGEADDQISSLGAPAGDNHRPTDTLESVMARW